MSDLYNRIEALCKSKGITVTQLCRDTGISRSTLSELHKGRTKSLSSKVSYKIATYFNVPLSYINENCITANPVDLMFGIDKIVLSEGVEENEQPTPADDSRSELYDDLNKLSDSELSKVEGFVKGLLAQGDSDK